MGLSGLLSPISSIRSPFGGGVTDAYAVAAFSPPLVFDFASEYYRTAGALSTFDDSLTYTGASAKTMVDSDGLVKWAPHNLALYSEDFTNATWGKSDATITAAAATAPDGSLTASKLVLGTGTHGSTAYLQQVVSFSGTSRSVSVFAKASDAGYIGISEGNYGLVAGVNLSTGSVDYSFSAEYTPTVTALPDGWFLITLTTTTADRIRLWPSTTIITSARSVTADGTSGIYLWGAHAYRSNLGGMVDNPDRSDSYVPTTSAAVYLPRRGHHIYNGSTWVNEGIQIESEERTNLLTYSHEFDTVWTNLNSGVLTQDQTGPAGANTAWKFVDSGATGSGLLRIEQAVTVATTTTYTASVFAKADQLSWLFIQAQAFTTPASGGVYFNLTTGAVGTVGAGFTAHTPVNYGNGWWRCAITFTTDAADTAGNIKFFVSDGDGDLTVDYDGTSSILIYGAQFELGSTPSSYIPTAGATVTRAAETLTVAAANLPYSAVAMSMQMDGEMTYAAVVANQVQARWFADSQNYIQLNISPSTTAQQFLQESLNVSDNVSVTFDNPGVNTSYNIASRHGATFLNGAVDGTAGTADLTPVTLPDLSATNLQLGTTQYMGTIGKFRMWDEDLGDTGIASAST